MVIHTLKAINAEIGIVIRRLVKEGYRIVPIENTCTDSYFDATLSNDKFIVEIHSYTNKKDDTFNVEYTIRAATCKSYINSMNIRYYKIHDDLYSESKLEAQNERVKWIAHCLGVDPESKNPWQAFADKLCKEITDHSWGDNK